MTWIKKLYLYVVSLVSLIIVIVAAVMLVNMGLKAAFKVSDSLNYPCIPAPASDPVNQSCNPEQQQVQDQFNKENAANQRKRDLAQSLAMIIVATPVFVYHWRLTRKET